ncbi:MAG: hypothetical protein ACREDW_09665 [Aestuariivirgaceae bacterium]
MLCLGFVPGPAAAAECSDIYPNARQGPPSDWEAWDFGSACYTRWRVNAAEEEQALAARCRETPGARYLLFDQNNAAGHATCIFEIAQTTAAVQPTQATASPEQQSNQMRKSDADNPLLDQLGLLVARWNQACLEKENDKDYAAAGACWKEAAKSVHDAMSEAEVFKTPQLEEKAEQLQSAWLMRAEQLEPYLKGTAKRQTAVEPASLRKESIEKDEADAAVPEVAVEKSRASSRHDGPDPRRLAETAVCSSTNLGDARKCVLDPVALGEETYAFKIRPSCSSGVIAAIKTYDEQGRCIRRVVSITPRRRSEPLTSSAEPMVLDAVRDRGQDTLECYFRRHENISCNGKIDYDVAVARQRVAEVRSEEMPLSSTPKKKRKRWGHEITTEEPSLIGRMTKGIKNFFSGGDKDQTQ